MNVTHCAIIGYELKPQQIKSTTSTLIEYETPFVGKVKIGLATYNQLYDGNYERYLIAGICKHRTIDGLEPLMINQEFITEGYKQENPPIEFDEKCYALLKALYILGGKENKDIELNSTRDFALSYANPEEFCRLVEQLENDNLITIRKTHRMARGNDSKLFMGIKMTSRGKDEAKKSLPQIPLVGLVSQVITTGDYETDQKINHARELFFALPQNMDKMRSACEALSYVLEPIRDSLANHFSDKDVSDFFQLVNRFDIRHNKDTTKALKHPEQLEWVFYTLLNTINTYTKIHAK